MNTSIQIPGSTKRSDARTNADSLTEFGRCSARSGIDQLEITDQEACERIERRNPAATAPRATFSRDLGAMTSVRLDSMPPEEALRADAEHQAAHAVMRWAYRMKPTEIRASETGGCCFGTGEKVHFFRLHDLLAVMLAGHAWEAGCGLERVDIKGIKAGDFDDARRILAQNRRMRIRTPRITARNEARVMAHCSKPRRPRYDSVEAALQEAFEMACEMLMPHFDAVEYLGSRLASARRMSARSVAAFFRWYERNHC